MDTRQCVELFHLLFLGALGARVDRALFVLKGGCNLRFYWKSIRYSEDMDLDVKTTSVATLRNNVERVLEGPAFRQSLAAHQLALEEHSAPKQTDTTQRWKMAVRPLAERRSIPTKIEFSRRRLDPGHSLEPVDPTIQRRYKLYPVLSQHYGLSAAISQKVAALAGRPQTQARDVFDLKLLLDQGATATQGLDKLAAAAIEPAMSVGYDEFAGQVLAYLEPEYQDHYRPRKTWERTQEEVGQWLEGQAKP
jgi:predicted nucleotidyltransferase component of viral defense system